MTCCSVKFAVCSVIAAFPNKAIFFVLFISLFVFVRNLFLPLPSAVDLVMADRGDNLCGGIRQIDGENREEALDLLKKTLETLATGDGPSLKVVNVTSVSSQVVAGTLYRYKVQLSQDDNVKESYVEIWSQPWLKENGTNIKIKFDGEENNSVDKTF